MPSLTASKPALTVTIDKPRRVRFNWSSACRFEEAYGKSIPEAMQTNVGVRLISHLAWAGMLHEEPTLSMREVEKRLQSYINAGGDINKLASELLRALVESGVMGKPTAATDSDEEKPQDPPPADQES